MTAFLYVSEVFAKTFKYSHDYKSPKELPTGHQSRIVVASTVDPLKLWVKGSHQRWHRQECFCHNKADPHLTVLSGISNISPCPDNLYFASLQIASNLLKKILTVSSTKWSSTFWKHVFTKHCVYYTHPGHLAIKKTFLTDFILLVGIAKGWSKIKNFQMYLFISNVRKMISAVLVSYLMFNRQSL